VKYLREGINVQCNNKRYGIKIYQQNGIPLGRMHIFLNLLLKVHNLWLKKALSVISIFIYRQIKLINKPVCSIVLEKLIVNLLLEKFPSYYGT
jgi:hypothetical protein